MNATAAQPDRRPLLRLHRPSSAVDRMAGPVVAEFGDKGAAEQLRAARLLLGPAAHDDATAAALCLVQLALDQVERDAEELPGRALAMLDAVHAEYRAALREYMKANDYRTRRAFDAGRRRGRRDIT